MNIHDLNTKTLTDPAYVAFDDGSDTYKANFKGIIDDAAAEAVTESPIWDTINKVTVTTISGTVAVESNGSTVTQVVSATFPEAGTYLVLCQLTYPANTSGARTCGYAIGTATTITVYRSTSTMAVSSGSTMMLCEGVETVAAGTAIKLYARQTSGVPLTVQYARITLIRLK